MQEPDRAVTRYVLFSNSFYKHLPAWLAELPDADIKRAETAYARLEAVLWAAAGNSLGFTAIPGIGYVQYFAWTHDFDVDVLVSAIHAEMEKMK